MQLEATRKRIRIIEADIEMRKKGVPERQLTKRIAAQLKLEIDYVRKVRSALNKE